MKTQQFLDHYGLSQNPFSQEDAQDDPLFKKHCATATFHPAWEKIFGTPGEPSTSVVFGEKGAGKTAIRLQILEQVAAYNKSHPEGRVFVVEYDDFNPYLDCFAQRSSALQRRLGKVLSRWKLWDHIDVILSLATTRLVTDVLSEQTAHPPGPFEIHIDRLNGLSRQQKRDMLLLAACYDRNSDMHPLQRWTSLKRRLKFSNWPIWQNFAIGLVATIAIAGLMAGTSNWSWLNTYWLWIALAAGWLPWAYGQLQMLMLSWKIASQVRVIDHPLQTLRQVLSQIPANDLAGQPTPSSLRSDDRYELLAKLQGLLKSFGFVGMTVVVDRVDEPHLINGSPERMRDLIWPMFDNKFLKHSGLGFKLLLPAEVSRFLQRETAEFYEKSRLDKQNLVKSLDWTGESLYDLANDRIKATLKSDAQPTSLREWFDDSVTEDELISWMNRLRVPRHLFRFLHKLLVTHCQQYTEDKPVWKIARDTFKASLTMYLHDLDALDRGLGAG